MAVKIKILVYKETKQVHWRDKRKLKIIKIYYIESFENLQIFATISIKEIKKLDLVNNEIVEKRAKIEKQDVRWQN